ncbi:MAG: hypothetical protein U9O86_03195 [Campylobacterota bacterium]|nr:hypothetical protein [Campylobacterota bacterium]
MIKLLLLLLPLSIFAQSFMLSNIPLPKTYIQNLDPYECDEECMQEYLDEGMVFSFLAHAYSRLEDMEQNEARTMFVSIFNLGAFHSGAELKIALLLPYKKIGKYASSTTNASFAYLMTKGHPFMLKSYKIESEEREELEIAIDAMRADGFEYIIAPLTKKGADNVIDINPALNIYFPTINKKDVNTSSAFLSFGAIDYDAQSHLLLKEAVTPLVLFSDRSSTGKKLAAYQKEEFLNPTLDEKNDDNSSSSFFDAALSILTSPEPKEEVQVEVKEDLLNEEEIEEKVVTKHFISRKTTNLEIYLKEKEEILEGTFFLNTPIIKSGMIMSQLTLYDVNATNVLSTQINYDPLLLSMTQYTDRKEMIVANSITKHNNVLIETNSLLGNDIVYDWINYTTTIGVDYFYSLITDEDRTYNTIVENNQMIYDIELLRPARSKFVKYIKD